MILSFYACLVGVLFWTFSDAITAVVKFVTFHGLLLINSSTTARERKGRSGKKEYGTLRAINK